ncbi:FAD-dependent oxidoreductase [Lentzea nigeriaca]|uniref:FAD-dependent oxidoreductase n=1 Tax=Lentzea nigeriaca TaxID=1128665 RepID=UPI001EF850B3|nr:NAD(P)/FAD-dependent oxidoreductase [Lentzea nigeriaca]MBM7856337.1 2-polyprenyl-6-methoxyphenol hydroxylase-like FAD-dependent oxidoreductase [Lentzea nigeriaca]
MSNVIIVGGSVIGFGAALALADQGHRVRILERSTDEPPSTVDSAATWHRPTVPQFLQSHAFASLGCNLLRDRARDVYDGLRAAGAGEVNLADYPPPMLGGITRRPEDDDLRMVLSRRSTFELVLRERALARPGVSVRTGATVRGLVASGNRVTGVRLADGETIEADLVVDATGRKTAADTWLADADLPGRDVTSESCKIVYYTRYYRQRSERPPGPLNRGFGAGGLWDHYTAVLFLGDNGTFSISLGVLPEDTQMKGLREEEAFTAAVRATPLLAGWVAPGNSEPISPVYSMGSLDNSLRLPVEGQPLVEGFFPIGDALCTTNPAYGRGVSLGLQEAFLLADLLAEHPEPGETQAREFVARSTRLVRPWFEEAVMNDRGRAGLWEATVNGRQPQRPPAGVVTFGTAVAAASQDEEVWRRVANVMMMLKPPSALYADDEIRARVGKVLSGGPPPQLPGASRADLLAAVSADLVAK